MAGLSPYDVYEDCCIMFINGWIMIATLNIAGGGTIIAPSQLFPNMLICLQAKQIVIGSLERDNEIVSFSLECVRGTTYRE